MTKIICDPKVAPPRKRKSKTAVFVRVLPPVDGATLALAKLMQVAYDFDEAVWSGRVVAPHLEKERHG